MKLRARQARRRRQAGRNPARRPPLSEPAGLADGLALKELAPPVAWHRIRPDYLVPPLPGLSAPGFGMNSVATSFGKPSCNLSYGRRRAAHLSSSDARPRPRRPGRGSRAATGNRRHRRRRAARALRRAARRDAGLDADLRRGIPARAPQRAPRARGRPPDRARPPPPPPGG